MHRIKTTVETENVLNSCCGSFHVVVDFVAGNSRVGVRIAGGGEISLSAPEQTAKEHHH